jgi:seryl-tRNA synthetase
MLDIKWIRENPEALDRALASRGAPPASAEVLAIDEERRGHLTVLQEAQARQNAASKEIGRAKAAQDAVTAAALMSEIASIKGTIQAGEARERELDAALAAVLAGLPNLPLPEVPVGPDETANVLRSVWGEKPVLDFPAKEHFEIGETLGLMDFERAAKLSGARFTVLKGQIARLERALGQFMLDLHTGDHGYTEVSPPLLVRDDAMFGTGQLPKFEDDQFFAVTTEFRDGIVAAASAVLESGDGAADLAGTLAGIVAEEERRTRRWLIPTAEVPLTNLIREEILDEAVLPLRMTALTPCFRAEAGSAGRDVRGMLRQHQFWKVELVSVTTPEASLAEQERMLGCAEEVLRRLGLHYRVMTLSTGDMGFGAQRTFDIEVWLPGQDTYREISSVSVCGDFQARRMNARYRPAEGKGTRFVHTLNGSGVAVGRALIAVIENYQNADGTITVPEVLRPYMGGLATIG